MLNQLRDKSGIRQIDLAEKLGVHQSFISKFESGERRLDLVELSQICKSLDKDLVEFVSEYQTKCQAIKPS